MTTGLFRLLGNVALQFTEMPSILPICYFVLIVGQMQCLFFLKGTFVCFCCSQDTLLPWPCANRIVQVAWKCGIASVHIFTEMSSILPICCFVLIVGPMQLFFVVLEGTCVFFCCRQDSILP